MPYVTAYAIHPDITRVGDYMFRVSAMGEVQGRAGAKLGWYIHAVVFVLVNALIFSVSRYGFGSRPWSVVPLLGRRRSVARSLIAVAGAAAAMALWWGYAPARLGCRVPIASLWAGAPELGLATLVSTALAAVVVAVVLTHRRRERRPPSTPA